jgi:hypothetical protein
MFCQNACKIFLMIFLVLVVSACSSTETVIKDKRIEMTFPAVSDTVPGQFVHFPKVMIDSIKNIFKQLPDSARIEGEVKIPKGKAKARLSYDPKKNEFSLNVPEIKLDTTITDTTKFLIKKETTTAEKFGYATYGIIIATIIIVIVFCAIKFKWVK